MAALAFLLSMLAGQRKACLGEVVEVLTIQANERGCLALVLLMTAPAIRFPNRTLVGTRVEPGLSFHPVPDLGMTLQTFETAHGRSKFVTR
jgi:hypothetical protein